ncbi:probable galactinol--sucrose galactosyltransferase 5 [Hibiscus syriacus]|uniref:probable galactinol--sucrose galactosyltransferase 5 n=1 Tax=Hibiscus syriacus TaxID=106335 RepID=UPI0019224877|nr:probable galactinol--sucrose galactosyltransferase 5 [Hibiscus syriacus]
MHFQPGIAFLKTLYMMAKPCSKSGNLNKYTGVLGAFNCQGGGWCGETRRNQCFSQFSQTVTAEMNPNNIEWNSGKNPISIEGVQVFAMYFSQSKKLVLSKPAENIEISLKPFDFELITVSPVTVLAGKSVHFSPIGLVDMLNTGGAIQSLAYNESSVRIEVKGSGEVRAFASDKRTACKIDGKDVEFGFENHMVIVHVPWSASSGLSTLEYLF